MKRIDIENWKDIPGFEGLYEVSDLGNVRSLNYNHTGKIKILKPGISRGYFHVILYNDGKKKQFYIHRLEAITFIGPIPPGMQVNHINENKLDNRLSNLEIVTIKQNNNHGTRKERAGKSISKANKGKTPWNKGKKGKPHTAEHKAKISASMKRKRKLGNKIS